SCATCRHLSSPRYLSPQSPTSFPTRRSSDLAPADGSSIAEQGQIAIDDHSLLRDTSRHDDAVSASGVSNQRVEHTSGDSLLVLRSEEHTSELQSRENLVCRLLLEKKKTRHEISLIDVPERWVTMYIHL